MKSTTYPNERMQYISQLQSMVKSRRNQDGTRTFVVPDQPQEVSSPKLVTSQRKDVTIGI
jgi:hypothetical protein